MCLIQKSHPCPDKIADPMANGTYYDAASGMVWSAYSCMTPRYEAYTTIPYFVKSPAPNIYDSPNISVSITNPSTCYPMKVFSYRFVQLCLCSTLLHNSTSKCYTISTRNANILRIISKT